MCVLTVGVSLCNVLNPYMFTSTSEPLSLSKYIRMCQDIKSTSNGSRLSLLHCIRHHFRRSFLYSQHRKHAILLAIMVYIGLCLVRFLLILSTQISSDIKYIFLTIVQICYHFLSGLFLHSRLLILSNDVEVNPGPSQELTIMHSNMRSILSDPQKFDDLKTLASTIQLDVISISESWLKPQTNTSELTFDKFDNTDHIFRNDRRNRVGGGVVVWVKNDLICTRLAKLETQNTESVWISIRTKAKTIIFGAYYRPPRNDTQSLETFMNEFSSSIDRARQLKPDNIVIMGDFNAKHTRWYDQGTTDTCGKLLLDTLESLTKPAPKNTIPNTYR